jgi:hypothetical protein
VSPAASAPGGLPTRSEIQGWDVSYLVGAAARWRQSASGSEDAFAEHRQNIAAPGGTEWFGDAKDAALDRVTADTYVVGIQGDIQREAADIAESGSADIQSAQRKVLEAIAEAEADGFRVGEDLSLTDTRRVDVSTLAARQTSAAEYAEDIRWNAERLVQADSLVGQRLAEKSTELDGVRFADEGCEVITLVSNEIKLSPPGDSWGDDDGGGYKPHDKYPDHKPNGEWGPGNSGVEGDAEAQEAFKARQERTHIPIEREKVWVYLTDPETGRTLRREYDGLEHIPGQPNKYVGLEHKLGKKDPTDHQQRFDDLVRGGLPARGVLRGQDIEVVDAELIRTPRPDINDLPSAGTDGTVMERAPVNEEAPVLPDWGTRLTPQQMIDSGDPALIIAGEELRRQMREQGKIDPSGIA